MPYQPRCGGELPMDGTKAFASEGPSRGDIVEPKLVEIENH
jgi:hypothetical protein